MTTPELKYGGLGKRTLAMLIDGLLMLIPMLLINAVIPFVGAILVSLLYKPIFEASTAQATPGKRIMNLMVTDLDGNRIKTSTTFVRYLISSISGLFFLIGHFFAFFTQKKQAVHDLIANTLVLEGSTSVDVFEAWIKEAKDLFSAIETNVNTSTKSPELNRVQLLERLQKLKETGAITDAEFESEKAKILL